MCGRYSVAVRLADAARELRATLAVPPDRPPAYNVAPTQHAPIVVERAERRLGLARFGLVPAASEGPQAVGARYINLRAESIVSQKAFAEAIARRRCLVVADGFYEWREEGGRKQPYRIRLEGGGLLTFGGVFEIWKRSGGSIASFAILTTAASSVVRPIHERMPLIIPPGQRDRWLAPEEQDARTVLSQVQRADPVQLEIYRVSLRVGHPRHDDPSLIEPIDSERWVGPSWDRAPGSDPRARCR
jgi:putative SOS response-associated peptidase YedK